MIVLGGVDPSVRVDEEFKKRVLRDAVISIAYLKLTSVLSYMAVWYLVNSNSSGYTSTIIQNMLIAALPAQALHAAVMFWGAFKGIPLNLKVSLWMCMIMAVYNTFLGLIGCIYFLRIGYTYVHFVLALIFGFIALSVFAVICHDTHIIYTYKQMLVGNDTLPICCTK